MKKQLNLSVHSTFIKVIHTLHSYFLTEAVRAGCAGGTYRDLTGLLLLAPFGAKLGVVLELLALL